MDLIYNVTLSSNGYDELGHYLRTTLLAGCNSLATVVNPACTGELHQGRERRERVEARPSRGTALDKILAGEDPEKVMRGYQRQQRLEKRARGASRDGRRSRRRSQPRRTGQAAAEPATPEPTRRTRPRRRRARLPAGAEK